VASFVRSGSNQRLCDGERGTPVRARSLSLCPDSQPGEGHAGRRHPRRAVRRVQSHRRSGHEAGRQPPACGAPPGSGARDLARFPFTEYCSVALGIRSDPPGGEPCSGRDRSHRGIFRHSRHNQDHASRAACPKGGAPAGIHGHSETDHQDPRRLRSQEVAAPQTSQADSAGSIPVTRSRHPLLCS
jgi:hypothetical protein